VARWILDKSGCKKPLKRLWISSVTDKAIKDGFAHLKPGKEYYPLYLAAVTRAQSDWLVGINATRALTCKHNAQLSCGRVQTPTLSMIALREKEIKEFQPKSFYGLKAIANGITFSWVDSKSNSQRTFHKDHIEKMKQTVAGTLEITALHKKIKKSFSPALYDLTTLQQEANRRFGFSAKETLNIMQRLYENHKVLTYPRTDSRYLTTDMVETLAERLSACAVGPYKKLAAKLSRQTIKPNKAFVDNSKVSDHHAIIPTEQFVQLDHMTNDERKIYDMVVRRFLAVLSPACEYEETSIKAVMGNEIFTAKGTLLTIAGWREAYETAYEDSEEIEEESSFTLSGKQTENIAKWQKGTRLSVDTLTITEGKTKPPASYTEGTLIAAMEKQGLGTVATRADIIEKLFSSFLMEKKGNELHITSKGKQLLELVPEDLKSPKLTANWELRLQAIAKGQESDKQFMNEIEVYTQELIEKIKTDSSTFRHDNITRTKCPECGKFMLKVNGKHGEMLVCQDRECGYRETIARHTNARCPVCHKRLDLVGKGDGQKFVCSCGYKEKLSSFEQRKKKEGKGANKRDVNNYLRKQAKEANEPINNAFAEAFSKLNL